MAQFYKLVPNELRANLKFRRELLKACAKSPEFRRDVLEMCRRDPLFWVKVFCWTLDPRKLSNNSTALGARIPFITWDYQDDAILFLDDQLNAPSDVLIEKSRDMGASWIACVWMLWRWLFFDYQSFLMVSRKEMLVDGDEDSLFAHLRMVLPSLPRWMLPPGSYKDIRMQLKNHANGSVIDGESTTKNIGRGGRRTAILLDEFPAFDQGGFDVLAATADTTNCRIFNGTPKGTGNAFYAQREKGTPRIRFHWSLHPEKRRGLYRVVGPQEFEWLDPTFDYTKVRLIDESPRSDEQFRSPWYDNECKRRAHAWEIAQELDIDYQGSASPFFDVKLLDELKKDFGRAADFTGAVVQSGEAGAIKYDFVRSNRGKLKIWGRLDGNQCLPRDRWYVVGCDVSYGTGASDSVACAYDVFSGEKVCEMVHNRWGIEDFAQYVFNLCMWLNGDEKAYLIWEATGPGRTFGKFIVEKLHYPRFYFDRDDTRLGSKTSDRYGWFSALERKRDLLKTYAELLLNRTMLNYSSEALHEAGYYVFEGQSVEYRGPTSTNDPSTKGVNHGDRVIADALCAKLLFEYKLNRPQMRTPSNEPPVGSKAWRDLMWADDPSKDAPVLVASEW